MGNTELDVYGLCLGGNVFGWTIDEERSFAVLDAYVQAGGNFIDTADSYGRRGPGGPGESERIIGRWMAARGNRDELVIATKVGMSADLKGLSAGNVRAGAEASLRRLGIERIDLYYAHEDDLQTPLQETLEAFDELIEDGLVGHAAASNYSAERLRQALELSRHEGIAEFVALQPHYSLMEREYEQELAPLCEAERLACLPYFALARGFLSGKYRPGGEQVQSPRAGGVQESYANERGFAVLEVLDRIAQAHDVAVASVSLAWLRAKPTVLAPIASATSPEQVAELVASVELELSVEELTRLDEASSG
ncbi:MAG TPA: aldo/keto reductase [Solirubrobacteraceae bacterium]|nr:aldo/keto reductase [Solirubrobacteraceae bacterium]